MKYNWNWNVVLCRSECAQPYFDWILSGLGWTLVVSVMAWLIAFSVGSVVGVAKTAENRGLRLVAKGYVELFRNIPLLVQMFLWFYVVPELLPKVAGHFLKRELPLPEYWTAIVCLGLYHASRTAEQVRAGIEAIPRGQTLAALALGLTRGQVYRYVLLPVSYRIIVPPLTSDFMGIFKNSSVALTIGVLELTAQSRQIAEYTFNIFEIFTVATVLYMLVTLIVVTVMRYVEKKVRIPGTIAMGGS
ncbi:MAG: amino acid ABC transporter permease [Gammaproteobacteria bacterium]|nr:amino acid ABC transporter permease [Gammaproteobacteria bacterium]